MYKHVLKERIKLQRDRIRPEDLGDDIDDLRVSKKAKKRLKHRPHLDDGDSQHECQSASSAFITVG